ncbi:MAG: flap endonuclease-1 [Candidatus Hermodarchaeia archaeon]|jgi:flap endonuclease-1
MNLIYVFDGEPPKLKQREVETRRAQRIKAEAEYQEAIKAGDLSTAFSKAVQTGRLTNSMVDDAKRLLDLLGIPWIQAPEEGEAQAAHITAKGDVWASNSRDYDSLLFGTPRLVRYLTIQGQEWLPSQGRARKLEPELIELEIFLRKKAINREQLVDMAILIGTDFNQGLKGIGPKTALKLIKQYNKLENLPADIYSKLPDIYPEIRRIYLKPKVTNDYNIQRGEINGTGLYEFLCNNRDFSRKRVETVVKRMEQMQMQRSLDNWFKENR